MPVIVVSGVAGEEEAVESLKGGAHDYVLKGRLARLVPAVERALREDAERKAHKVAEETLGKAMMASASWSRVRRWGLFF